MKVIHSPSIRFMRGRESGSVYYEAPGQNFSIKRNYVYPTLTADNHTKGSKVKNLAYEIWPLASIEWKADLATYASRYYAENLNGPNYAIPVNNSFGNLVKMMFAYEASDPTHVDLETITVADIVALDAEVRTIARAIVAGFLPLISVFNDLTSGIQ